MRVGSLFAGIGGFDLAFERAGFNVAFQVEWDEAAQRVLTRRFPREPVGQRGGSSDRQGTEARGESQLPDGRPLLFSDVREVGAHNLPAVDVLVGGWPCQPVSVAGRRRASSDERDMWPEFARIAGELRPAWVVGENVPGALSAEGGAYFRRVVDDLTQLGYGVCWRTLDAQHFGVPQRRRRVFVVGCLGDLGRAAQVLLEPEGGGGDHPPSEQERSIAAGRIARSLGGVSGGGNDIGANKGNVVIEAAYTTSGAGWWDEEEFFRLRAQGGGTAENIVAHTLRAEGHDASEDGTGRGTPIIAAPLTSGGSPNSNAPGRRKEDDVNLAIGFRPTDGRDFTTHEEHSPSLKVGTGLGIAQSGPAVYRADMHVRRLTPTECERLQGFPDGWTDGQPDSTRYRQLGNAVAVPCVEWIARRLASTVSRGDTA